MKKLLLVLGVTVLHLSVDGQTSLYFNDFEGAPGFNLNTTTMGSSASGENPWIINSVYAGGSGTFFCPAIGFNVPFTVPPAPSQPAGISNANGMYMHVTPQIAINGGGTLPAASYVAADGFCIYGGQTTFTEMTSDFSTVGYTTVDLDFWWACGGSTINYGQMYYSTNSGTTWTAVNCPTTSTNQWRGQTTWLNTQMTDAAWANQATLRFGFMFVTGTTSGAESDPGFAIDDFEVIGSNGATNNITAATPTTTSWCEGTVYNAVLNFTSTGTYNGPNVYSAQLSDATGSFAAPTSIGTLASSASGSLNINISIPGSTAAGTGYRIRVVASDPATTGTDNGSDLVINPQPTVTMLPFSDVCVYDPMFTLTGGSPATGTYSGPGVTANVFEPSVAGLGTHTITYSYTDGNGCMNTAQETIFVDACSGLSEEQVQNTVLYPNPAEGTFSISGLTNVKSVEIIDLSGRTVQYFNEMLPAYDVSVIPPGTYFVRVKAYEGALVKQVIIQ